MYQSTAPYKSVAVALLFSVFLGPLGLLYASFWGGLFMIIACLCMLVGKYFFIVGMLWILSSAWSVRACEKYNRKIYYHNK